MFLPTSPVKAMVWGLLALAAGVGMHATGFDGRPDELACLRGAPRPGSHLHRFVTGVVRAKDPAAVRNGLVVWEEHERAGLNRRWTEVARQSSASCVLEEDGRRTEVELFLTDEPGLSRQTLPDGHRLRGIAEGSVVTVLGDRAGDAFIGAPWPGTPAEVEAGLVAREGRTAMLLEAIGALVFTCGLLLQLAKRRTSPAAAAPAAAAAPTVPAEPGEGAGGAARSTA